MLRKMFILVAILGFIGGMAYATNSGGGDKEHAYYWWNDNKATNFSGYNYHRQWVPESSYVFRPEEIPWFRWAANIPYQVMNVTEALWNGSNPAMPDPAHPLYGSCPEPFVHWIELAGWTDNPAADSFFTGHILAVDGEIVHSVDLRTGGKLPPEMTLEPHFVEFDWDRLYFFLAERLYTEIDVSSDGWAAFNAGDILRNPHGKIPEVEYPNATVAAYWTDLVPEQQKWPAKPYGPNPPWGVKAWNHPWWDRTWWDRNGNQHTYGLPEYSYVHADSGAVLWGLRFYRIRLNVIDTTYVDPSTPQYTIRGADLWIPVFVIEWCDVALASHPSFHYRFQLQLLNPVPDDSLWAYFVGRWGKPGLTDTIAETEVSQMYIYQGRILIPQQIFFFYHSRYNEATGERYWHNEEPPGSWAGNADNYDLVGIENADGSRGLTTPEGLLKDLYVVKYDYFKRYYNDFAVTIVNPPYNIVLRWTELRPVVIVSNYGRNSANNVPVSINVERGATQVYYDNLSTPLLNGLGTDRWATPYTIPGSQAQCQFAKIWIPEEIGTRYDMRAMINWGKDENPVNDVHEKELLVHCDDTLKYHTNNPTTYTGVFSASYLPWGGSQLGFSWVKGLGCWILAGFPEDCYEDFEMALVEDNVTGWGLSGHPNEFTYTYHYCCASGHLIYKAFSSTVYPALDMTSPHHGRSADHDGWYDFQDASVGPPNLTILNKNLGFVWYNDTLYLGDSLAPGCWTRNIEPDLYADPLNLLTNGAGTGDPTAYCASASAETCPVIFKNFPDGNEPDAWMCFLPTGIPQLGSHWGNQCSYYGYCGWFLDVLMVQEGAGGKRVNTPYWDLASNVSLFMNTSTGKKASIESGCSCTETQCCYCVKGPHGPVLIAACYLSLGPRTGTMTCTQQRAVNTPPYHIPYISWPFLLSATPETIPVHPMLETYIHTCTYDACLYEITKPMMWNDAAEEPGYYFEDNTSVNFECKIANIGRVLLTDETEHRFRVFAEVRDEDDEVIFSSRVGIESLDIGDSLIKVKPPAWENTGEGGKEYRLIICVNYAYPGLHQADHCPYNDSIEIPFWVLWTYDVACTQVMSPGDGDIIDPGDTMSMSAEFSNLGYRDTTDIPVTVKVFNAGDEIPPDSMLYQSNYIIRDLNWRGSPSGPPIREVVEFGGFEVPPTTYPEPIYPGRFMRVEFRLAEVWMDEDPANDAMTVYVNPPPGEGVVATEKLPRVFNLSKVLPNPVGGHSAVIKYAVPYNSRVSIKVYDISGKLVRNLVSGVTEAGYREVTWNGTDDAGKRVAHGIYFVRMNAPEYTGTKKLVLLR